MVGTPGRGARAWAAHRILDAWVASAAARRLRCRSERLVAAGVTGAGRRTSGTPNRAIPGRGLPCRLRPAPGRRMPHSADLTPTAPAVQAAPCPASGGVRSTEFERNRRACFRFIGLELPPLDSSRIQIPNRRGRFIYGGCIGQSKNVRCISSH